MARDVCLLDAKMVQQGDHIPREFVQAIVDHVGGLVAEVITTLIQGNHPVTGVGQRHHLILPASPKFGKAMQKNHDLTAHWAGGDGVKPNAIQLKEYLVKI